jgi:hypothetical protein
MSGRLNWRGIRRAGPAAALLLLCSVAFATDAYYRGDAVEHYGHENGYRDGIEHGRYDRAQHFHYNIHSQLYNDARDGYSTSMGPYGYFKRAYRDAYARGYAEGYNERVWDGYHWR